MPANGVSSGSVSVPPTTRHRFRQVNTSSPSSSRPGPVPSGSRPPTTGDGLLGRRDVHFLEARIPDALGDRGANDDRITRRNQRMVARRQPEHDVDTGAATSGRDGTSRTSDGARSSPVAPGRDGGLPCLERLAAKVCPIGQPERDVAEIDHQPAQPAGHVDREMPAATTQPDRVVELEFGDGGVARRQIDKLEAPRSQVALAGAVGAMKLERARRSGRVAGRRA